jgi:hypothetical protein
MFPSSLPGEAAGTSSSPVEWMELTGEAASGKEVTPEESRLIPPPLVVMELKNPKRRVHSDWDSREES